MDDGYDIVIDPDGTTRFIYSDDLAQVFAGEAQETRRASHVEPHPTKPGWLADMSPSGGPVLGASDAVDRIEWTEELTHPGTVVPGFRTRTDGELELLRAALEPFKTRQAALDAEREWLQRERGL